MVIGNAAEVFSIVIGHFAALEINTKGRKFKLRIVRYSTTTSKVFEVKLGCFPEEIVDSAVESERSGLATKM